MGVTRMRGGSAIAPYLAAHAVCQAGFVPRRQGKEEAHSNAEAMRGSGAEPWDFVDFHRGSKPLTFRGGKAMQVAARAGSSRSKWVGSLR